MRFRLSRHLPRLLAAVVVLAAATFPMLPARAGEVVVAPVEIVDDKAVFGRIESRDLLPARARIGGTLATLDVTEGSTVAAGQVVAIVVDDKLALQLRAIEARIRALDSELANARTELERAQSLLVRGSGTQQRVDQLRTQVEVLGSQSEAARSDRAVIVQQAAEGQVLAPTAGRVLRVPVTRGAVIMPGEPIALVAGGGLFLRLALPERHAALLKLGARVAIEATPGAPAASGRLVKVYPQIENGRVIADVEAERIAPDFVGERVLVRVPVATRTAIAVPAAAVTTRSGIDLVRLATPAGPREVAVVVGPNVETAQGPRVEILSGLAAGDRVIVP
ncbi:MAG: efflux RND transporter periplasmic adaptor subunit [Alphaproteobacteria bacterium]|nr:efflux RND transporter periplasmic adaptor subunit [Alphaproteobacteria bacterium]